MQIPSFPLLLLLSLILVNPCLGWWWSENNEGLNPGPRGLPKADVHSPKYLLNLAEYERSICTALLRFIEEFDKDPPQLPHEVRNVIDKYLKGYSEDLQAIQQFNASAYSSYSFTDDYTTIIAQNPLLSFKMVWRFADELKYIHIQFMKYGRKIPASLAKSWLADEEIANTWPIEKTVDECIIGLLRLQMTYDLNVTELASGIILGVETGVKLSIHQGLRIGEAAKSRHEYTSAIPWLELAVGKLQANELNDRNIRLEDVLQELNTTISSHDTNWINKHWWNYFYYNHTILKDGVLMSPADRVPIRKLDRSADRRKKDWLFNEANFWSLCNGDNHQTELEKSQLNCWYETKALTIFPIKTELLSNAPFIIQMYDFIQNSTMMNFLDLASSRLTRSHVVDVDNAGVTVESKVRTSVEGWVYDPMSKLTRLIEFATGLSVSKPLSAEAYLVATYSFGGHYDCHLDSFENPGEYLNKGNRIATIMFYFIDTPLGGRTAFPQAGIAARPIRGSAVFWYNLKRNGERDHDTYHCACPVILGHKIISTKWIRFLEQFSLRKCSLSQDE